MMNIQSAVKQMRIQRHLGKLSVETQNRIVRRMRGQSPSNIAWGRMMGLCRSINAEVAPLLDLRHQAEINMTLPPSKRVYA